MSFLQRRYSAIGGENLTHFLCNQTSNQWMGQWYLNKDIKNQMVQPNKTDKREKKKEKNLILDQSIR